MLKVYVSANVNKANLKALLRSLEEVEVICRRILVARCLPIAPAIWFARISQDPRLKKTPLWWVENIHVCLMEGCDIFCFIPQLIGLSAKAMKMEKVLWKELYPNKPVVPSDVIMNFLLERQDNDVQ